MLIFIGYLSPVFSDEYPYDRVSVIFHFSIIFVLVKLATSSVRVKPIKISRDVRIHSLGNVHLRNHAILDNSSKKQLKDSAHRCNLNNVDVHVPEVGVAGYLWVKLEPYFRIWLQ